jgi:hypothetical protein
VERTINLDDRVYAKNEELSKFNKLRDIEIASEAHYDDVYEGDYSKNTSRANYEARIEQINDELTKLKAEGNALASEGKALAEEIAATERALGRSISLEGAADSGGLYRGNSALEAVETRQVAMSSAYGQPTQPPVKPAPKPPGGRGNGGPKGGSGGNGGGAAPTPSKPPSLLKRGLGGAARGAGRVLPLVGPVTNGKDEGSAVFEVGVSLTCMAYPVACLAVLFIILNGGTTTPTRPAHYIVNDGMSNTTTSTQGCTVDQPAGTNCGGSSVKYR